MITEKQIKEGLDKAYKEAGHNAYFGKGFKTGVKFILDFIKRNKTEMGLICPKCNSLLKFGNGDSQYPESCRPHYEYCTKCDFSINYEEKEPDDLSKDDFYDISFP